MSPAAGVVMGSQSDLPTLEAALEALRELEVPYEVDVVSAHRTPQAMVDYGLSARARGLKVIGAGAGGAAHLPGMLASLTTLPVIGVPVRNGALEGIDALLSIVQMPPGVPVATVSIGGARNAGILAAQILSTQDEALVERLEAFRARQRERVAGMSRDVRSAWEPGA